MRISFQKDSCVCDHCSWKVNSSHVPYLFIYADNISVEGCVISIDQ